ncbi:MAG: hypothetical protein COA59_17675 [Colwellia sp.]|nr:MAG: hypothetical protein COA59_17675 [Colwellia sp.]
MIVTLCKCKFIKNINVRFSHNLSFIDLNQFYFSSNKKALLTIKCDFPAKTLRQALQFKLD